jgi:hypothetical protein
MIQAATRGRGGEALVVHLLRRDENELVEILPARGVAAEGFRAQLREIVARAAHGRTERPVLHLHVDPSTDWTELQYTRHVELYEAEFGLAGQPRLAVFHRKHDRGHRHYVWSLVRRDGSVISMSYDYARREKISRILEFEFGEPHVVGRHNRAVAAVLRLEGRLDVAASIEAAGLLDAERPVAKQTSAGREQEKRTRVRQATVENIVLTAWQVTSDGPGFESALAAEGLALAIGDEVPVLVDRTGNAHPLARLVGKVTKAARGKRVGVAEVRQRIKGLALLQLADARLEARVAAIMGDLEQEITSASRQTTPDPRQELPGDGAILAELVEIIPIAGAMAAEESSVEMATAMDGGIVGLPGDAVETKAAEALLDDAVVLLAIDQEDDLEVADEAEIAGAEMIDALAGLAMVPDGEEAREEETGYAGRPSQSGSTHGTWRAEFAEGGHTDAAERTGNQISVHGDTPEDAPYRGTDRQDRRASAGRAVDAEAPSGAEPAGSVEPDHPQPGPDDRHDGRNTPSPAAGARTGAGSRAGTTVGLDHTGMQGNRKPLPEAKLHMARRRLREAERQVGWVPGLLKRWFNLSVGKQVEADRARLEVEQIETEIRIHELLHQQTPMQHEADHMTPDATATAFPG